MTAEANCPPEEQLAAYAAGDCPDELARRIGRHAAECKPCAQWLDEAEQNEAIYADVVETLSSGGDAPAPDGRGTDSSVVSSDAAGGAVLPRIPGYRAIRMVGHGGQGTVYEAVQESTRRRVALKVLLSGTHASPTARRRFEREIELAARLKHPNIVTVFDSGITQDGHRYCVMDYIDGAPLDDFVRDQRLSLEETLTLARGVCQAVAHAHQKGVLHRDLKPSNVLVDAAGNPQVLDFGLAKSADGQPDTLVSLPGQLVGTLPYASPEHVAGTGDEVDMRSDVYALGVILYRLLTGEFPYPVAGGLEDVLHQIAETPPLAPGRAWSGGRGVRSRRRGQSLTGDCPIDGELETILLKALAKEPRRRYQSADELDRDLGHYLAGEPIEAKRDSSLYMLRKSLRRYRAVAVLGAATMLTVMLALVLVIVYQQRANRARADQRLANDLARLHESLVQTDSHHADLPIRNLRNIAEFQDNHPQSSQATSLERVRLANESTLRLLVERAIVLHDFRSLSETIVGTPQAVDLLAGVADQRDANDIVTRLRRRLECWVRVPPPVGKAGDVAGYIDALERLDPGNEKARAAEESWAGLLDSFRTVPDADFVDAGGVRANPECGVAGSEWRRGGWIQLNGSCSSSCTWSRTLRAPLRHRVISCSWSMAPPRSTHPDVPAVASVNLSGGQGGDDDTCYCHVVTFGDLISLSTRGRDHTPFRAPRSLNDTMNLELRYYAERGTCDLLLDGRIVIEEAPGALASDIKTVEVIADFQSSVEFGDLRLAVRDEPVKRDLGPSVPVVVHDELGLAPVRFLPLDTRSTVVHDFDGDGWPEIAVGDRKIRNQLELLRLIGPHFDVDPVAEITFDGKRAVRPVSMVHGHLAVFTSQRSAGDGQYTLGVELLTIAGDDARRTVFEAALGEMTNADMAEGFIVPLGLGSQRHGFAVGVAQPLQSVAVFEAISAADGRPYQRVDAWQPLDESGAAHDVHSLAPWDFDDDGDDDLLLGWGDPNGRGPVLVTMHGGRAAAAEPHRLTARLGETRLAGPFSTDQDTILPGAVARGRVCDDNTRSGAWLWSLNDVSADRMALPVFHEPCNAYAVAVGSIGRRSVLAVADIEPLLDTRRTTLRLRLYNLPANEDGVTLIWESLIAGVTADAAVQLATINVNDHESTELLACVPGHGVYIFAMESTDASDCPGRTAVTGPDA